MKTIKIEAIEQTSRAMSVYKGIGILLVVIGHTHCPDALHDFIYLFHMALFYFVTGYFFKDKYLESPKTFLIKKVKRLYFPWVMYGAVFLALHNLFVTIGFYQEPAPWTGYNMGYYTWSDYLQKGVALVLMNWQEILLAPLWFLKSLLVASVMFFFVHYLCEKTNAKSWVKWLLFGLIFVGGGILTRLNIRLPLNLVRESLAVGVICIGYWAGRNIRKIPVSGYGAIVCFIVLVLCMRWGYIEFSIGHITNLFYFLICSISGIYLVFYLSYKLATLRIISFLFSYIGQHTIEILCLHFLAFKLTSWFLGVDIAAFPVVSKPYLWPIYTVLGITIPILYPIIVSVVKKYREK